MANLPFPLISEALAFSLHGASLSTAEPSSASLRASSSILQLSLGKKRYRKLSTKEIMWKQLKPTVRCINSTEGLKTELQLGGFH